MQATSSNAGPDAQPFVFEGRWTEADIVHMRRCHDVFSGTRSLRWGMAIGATFLGAFILLAIKDFQFEAMSVADLEPNIVTVGVALFWLVAIGWMFEIRLGARRYYRRRSDEFLDTRISLSSERVAIECATARSEFDWKWVGFAVVSKHGILFYGRVRQVLFWLPERLLEKGDLRQKVLDLAQAKGVRVRRV